MTSTLRVLALALLAVLVLGLLAAIGVVIWLTAVMPIDAAELMR